MKFSFDGKSYRKLVSDSLREERDKGSVGRENAKKLLEKERETLSYKAAAGIKRVFSSEKNREDESRQDSESPGLREIASEVVHLKGSDGTDYALRVRTMDISGAMPDAFKVLQDMYRLRQIDQLDDAYAGKLSDYDSIGDLSDFVVDYLNDFISEIAGEISSDFVPFSRDVLKGRYSSVQRNIAFHAVQRTLDRINKDYVDFLNTLCGGALYDEYMFVHVLGAEHFGRRASGLDDFAREDELHERLSDEKAHESPGDLAARRYRRYPHVSSDGGFTEQVFNVQEATSSELYFGNGEHAHYMYKNNPLPENAVPLRVICNSRRARFFNEVKDVSSHSELHEFVDRVPMSTLLSLLAESGLGTTIRGLCLDFKQEEPWFLLADYILDPYHNRMYVIEDFDEETGAVSEERDLPFLHTPPDDADVKYALEDETKRLLGQFMDGLGKEVKAKIGTSDISYRDLADKLYMFFEHLNDEFQSRLRHDRPKRDKKNLAALLEELREIR